MRVPLALVLVLLTIGVCHQPVCAQETTGRLEGHAVDSKGQPVPFVNVGVLGPALQGGRGTQTDADGNFVLLALAVGDYTVKLTHLAYQLRMLENVRIQLNHTTSLGTIRLEDKVVMMEEVVVSGQSSLLDPGSTVYGDNLAARDYQALPIERDYKSVAVLLPHANLSMLGDPVNFAGGTGLENRYFMDGIDVTDPFRSATATNLPYNFVQEIQVRTGGYEAEYRSSLGGTVNAVTYSGGNAVTGQVFGFFTSNGLSATPRSVPGQPSSGLSYGLYDAGGGVGGPILKDRLWYYAAYNPSFTTEQVAIPGWAEYEDHSTAQNFAGKLTWRANDKNTFVFTSIGDPTRGRRVTPPPIAPASLDPFLSTIRQGGLAGILEGRHMVRDKLFLRTSLSLSTRVEDSTPETAVGRSEAFFIDSTGVASGGGSRSQNRSRIATAGVYATWIERANEVKAGVEYRDTRLDFDIKYDILSQSSATLYYSQLASFNGHVGSRMPSVFVEHSWRPTERLIINDGLRWDGQYWISSKDKVAQTILEEWQPRVGMAYQPGRLGTQKVSASFGRFYQDLTTAPLFWYYNLNSVFYSALYDHDPRADASGADTTGYSGGAIQPALVGLQGQFFDEYTLGYDRELGFRVRLGLRGVQRILGQGIEDGISPGSTSFGLSNPGLGALSAFPKMTRRYSALEVNCRGQLNSGLAILASYVFSRNLGSYEGLFDSRLNNPYPNATGLYDVLDQMPNSTGLLPNDRTHVFKLSGSYRTARGVTLGGVGVVESGTPLSEFGGTPTGPPYGGFIGARGSHGRTPGLWDLNLRIGYEPAFAAGNRLRPRLTVDVFHVAGQRKAVRYDEVHYRALDSSGNQIDPNPNYGMPIAFQSPMAVRLGMEVGF